MIRIILLGYGKVNQHVCKALTNAAEVSVIQVFNKTVVPRHHLPESVSFTTILTDIKEADLYLLGIPDDAISDFSEQLPFQDRLVAHTSGGADMHMLSGKNRKAVWYPLQSFSTDRELEYHSIPVCIEAEMEEDLPLLAAVGKAFSGTVVERDSEARAKLHLAAVFVNNFVNHLYTISEELLKGQDQDFELLKPLIRETADKLMALTPREAQTGPARRKDQKTIEKHLHLLKDSPYKHIYEMFTTAIQQSYGEKL